MPPGTVVTDLGTGEVLGDLIGAGDRLTVAAGGSGGRGNASFASPTRQAPRLGELGERGEHRRVHLELKLIADVGLVGLPNAGKSTLLAALTGARPRIAAYPFTTLHPNLGVAELEGGHVMVLADVPGIIEGAQHGAGLGVEFLRHLERTRVLVHVVDCAAGPDAAREAIRLVGEELRGFSPALAARPALVALNKVDLPEAALAARELAAELPGAHPVSAVSGTGLAELVTGVAVLLAPVQAGVASGPSVAGPTGGHRLYLHEVRAREPLRVTRDGDGAYVVTGAGAERMVERTDLAEEEAVVALQRRLRAAGVDAVLAAAGCREGDTVRISGLEFIYAEEGGGGAPGGARRHRSRPEEPVAPTALRSRRGAHPARPR